MRVTLVWAMAESAGQKLAQQLKAIVGNNGWISDPTELAPHLTEWRDRVRGNALLMVSPNTVDQVAAVVRACADAEVVVVAQGGNTGMCAGAVPDESGEQVLLNLGRLNRIRQVDPLDYSMVVEAGCILADVQAEAQRNGRLFPLSLGGEGSCQIGGNVSTNAGGINVLRYGTMRDLVLGLEVVLADGSVWNGLKSLRKDTAGYDLKQLFIGSEGTLGVITAATLKLFPRPGEITSAMLAVRTATDAVRLLAEMRERLPDRIQAFELIGERAMCYVLEHIPATRLPFAQHSPWYVLIDLDLAGGVDQLAGLLEPLSDRGLVADAVVAKNNAEREALWRLRHSISEAERHEGGGIKHDISVPVGALHEFLVCAEQSLARQVPVAIPVVFGHVGDGNLHYNVHLPENVPNADRGGLSAQVTESIYQLVKRMGGSISAEHGIGVLKRDALEQFSDPQDLRLMRAVKKALDPQDILNRGKVI
jgi:FAD/FMN-containing dehydrogenase